MIYKPIKVGYEPCIKLSKERILKTRLISIVSKPILIVVVVVDIDVVFVKNMLDPKRFG